MNEENLIKYYNKFNEKKRLERRHGQVEFITTMKYIEKYLSEYNDPKIIEIGAGCGKYSITLFEKGYDVTAVELVKHNLKEINITCPSIKTMQANATNLGKIKDSTYDIVLLFGPMYHLISEEEKIKALNEAKRILKDNGIIMVVYCMSDYAIIKHGFIENFIHESIQSNKIDKNFNMIENPTDLYSYVDIDYINKLNSITNLKRINMISQDGPSDYIRPILNKMNDETFKTYIDYHLSRCERKDLIGASSHILDILKK